MRDVSDFAFASLLTQPEVAPLIYTVRCACEDVAVMRLFDCSKTRTLKLTEFTQLQSQKTASTVAYLRDKWAPSILNSVTDQLDAARRQLASHADDQLALEHALEQQRRWQSRAEQLQDEQAAQPLHVVTHEGRLGGRRRRVVGGRGAREQ